MTDAPERGLAARLARNREIARLRDEDGLSWGAVAEPLGISVRTATRGYQEHHQSAAPESLAAIDTEALCLRAVRSHLLALDRLEPLAARRDNANAAVGAARSLASVSASLLAVLGRVGLLPEPGDRWRLAAEARALAEEFVEGLRRAGVPSEVADEVLGVANAAAHRLDPGPIIGGTAEVPAP